MIECEVLAGLKPAAATEVRRVLGRRAEPVADDDPTPASATPDATALGFADGCVDGLLAARRWWSAERAVQMGQKGHHPRVYVLRRRDETGGTGD